MTSGYRKVIWIEAYRCQRNDYPNSEEKQIKWKYQPILLAIRTRNIEIYLIKPSLKLPKTRECVGIRITKNGSSQELIVAHNGTGAPEVEPTFTKDLPSVTCQRDLSLHLLEQGLKASRLLAMVDGLVTGMILKVILVQKFQLGVSEKS